MKDKLIKTGRNKRFYTIRKLLIVVAVLGILGACVAVPVSIKLHSKAQTVLVVR